MNISKLTLLLVLAILCMGSIGIVSAGDVTVDTTGSQAMIGKTITVPVIMHNADRIQSFTMKVPNSVPGTTIVLKKETPLDSFGTWSKSEVYQDTGKFIWATNDPAYGISGDTVTLFYIDVTPTIEAESPITVVVNVEDIYDLDDTEVTANYPVTSGSLEIAKAPTVNTPTYSEVTTTTAKITFTTSGTVTEAKVHITSPADKYFTADSTGTAGEYTATLTGLTPSTEYTVKGWAKNSVGNAESATPATFTTETPKSPVVTIPVISEIGTTSAKAVFQVSEATPTVAKIKLLSSTGAKSEFTAVLTSGEYVASLTDLTRGETYAATAYASNDAGFDESDPASFTTLIPTTIEISNAPASPIGIGKTGTLTYVVKDQNGDSMPTEQVSWSSSNPAAITIDQITGKYKAVAAGTAKLTATSKTVSLLKQETSDITVVDGPAVSINAPISGSSVFEGTVVSFNALASGFVGDVTYSWTFGDGETGTGAAATHTYTATGSKTIKVEASGKDKTGADATAADTITLTVTGKPAAAEITVPATLYLGETGTAKAVIKDSDGNTITDYTGMTFAWTSSDDSVIKVSSANAAAVTLTAGQTKGKATVSVLVTGTGFTDISADSSAITVDERPVQTTDNGGADDGLELLKQAGTKPTATATPKPTTAADSKPTVSVTVSPTNNPGTSTAATTAPTTAATTEAQQPTATQGSVPVLGILAGLGAAVALGRKHW